MKSTDLASYIANVLSKAATKISVVLRRPDAHDVEFEEPKLVLIAGQLKSDGTVTGPAADGKIAVTEASCAGMAATAAYIETDTRFGNSAPTINAGWNAVDVIPLHRRIGRVQWTTDAGGDKVYAELVPALAGYYGVMRVLSIKANVNTAAGATITFESPAATAALPTVEAMPALTANTRRNDCLNIVVTHATLVDNQAIGAILTNFGAPGVTIVEMEYEFWYET